MKVTIEKPEMLFLVYRQEKSDPDYGSCLWARFYLDMVNYTMVIESDCGGYSHKWVPTPDSESFIALLCRMHTDYLLTKISDRTVIDGAETWKNIRALIEDAAEDEWVELSVDEMKEIKAACFQNHDINAVVNGVKDAIASPEVRAAVEADDYALYCCIEKDFPAAAKKIVSVFDTCIRPELKKLNGSEQNG